MPEGGRRHGLKTEDLKHLIYGLSIHMIIVWHKLPTGMFFRKYHKKTGLNIPRGSLKQASASAILIYVSLISNFERERPCISAATILMVRTGIRMFIITLILKPSSTGWQERQVTLNMSGVW